MRVVTPSFSTRLLGLGFDDSFKRLFITRDGGRSWERAAGQPCRGIGDTADSQSLVAFPSPEKAWVSCTFFVGTGRGVFHLETVLYASRDGAKTFRPVSPGLSRDSVPEGLSFSSGGFGFVDDYDVFERSADRGRHWGFFAEDILWHLTETLPVPASPRAFYSLRFEDGVQLARSDDGGDTWSVVHRWQATGAEAEDIEDLKATLADFGNAVPSGDLGAGYEERLRVAEQLEESIPGSDVRAAELFSSRNRVAGPIFLVDFDDGFARLGAFTPEGHSVQLVVFSPDRAERHRSRPRFVYIVDMWLDEVISANDQ